MQRLSFAAVLTLLATLCAPPVSAQRWDAQAPTEAQVSVGRARTLWSSALQEPRELLISLPPDYERSGKAYPVVYLLDAEMQFVQAAGTLQFLGSFNERIPEMILVGVVNVDRSRDFVPPARNPAWRGDPMRRDGYERTNPDAFLKFLAEELAPWVEARYRTVPYRILVGHSFGGVFSLHAMVHRPEAFQAQVAISPSLWYDGEALIGRTEAGIRALQRPPWLFVSWADHEENIRATTEKLVRALTANPPPALRWEHRYYPGEDHMSTPHRALYDALELLFTGWRMPQPVGRSASLEEVEAHYAALSQRFGFRVAPSPAALGGVAYGLVEQKRPAEALDVLRRVAREYPYLAASHQALGEALEKMGRHEEARRAHEQAVRAALEDDSPYGDPVGEYRAKVRELEQAPAMIR
jgi:predicted alpha/beta superfamily hydrolase